MNMMVNAKFSMKVNFKLRGTNHGLADNYDWYGAKAHTMIVGADVTHPGKTTNPTMPSMAGVVATRDSRSAHYLGSARLQDKNNEVRYYLLSARLLMQC
jgi:hypothetical protein